MSRPCPTLPSPAYRHRGHRYISQRKFDAAIADFNKAAELMQGAPIEMEPDGQPNKINKPLSTTQFNVWYHLGLAHYLKEEFDEAIKNNDKPVLSKHLYLVWSIAEGDYWFRHHLETKNSELKKTEGAKEGKRFYRLSTKGFIDLNPIKVKLNHLGEITKIGEY